MATEIKIHEAQAKILRTLLFKTEARFRDLNIDKLTTDHFTFHLKQLLEQGIVGKVKEKYRLTAIGKEFANRFDTEKIALERQAKLAICIVGVKKDKKGTKYLSQQRLKNPFFGYRGFVTGKIRWGDRILDTAARELKEETGLTAKLEYVAMEHKMDYAKNTKQMLEDKFFFIVRATQPKGKLIENFEGGRNSWLTEKEIINDSKVFEDVSKILQSVKSKSFIFFEDKYYYSGKQY